MVLQIALGFSFKLLQHVSWQSIFFFFANADNLYSQPLLTTYHRLSSLCSSNCRFRVQTMMACTATGVHPEQIWCMPTAIWLKLLPFHLHHLCCNLNECSFLDNLLLPIKPKLYFTSQELYNCQASLVCCLPLRISTTQSTTWFTMHQSNLELANTSCLHHRRGFSLIKAFSSRCTSTLHWLTPCHITRTCDLLTPCFSIWGTHICLYLL